MSPGKRRRDRDERPKGRRRSGSGPTPAVPDLFADLAPDPAPEEARDANSDGIDVVESSAATPPVPRAPAASGSGTAPSSAAPSDEPPRRAVPQVTRRERPVPGTVAPAAVEPAGDRMRAYRAPALLVIVALVVAAVLIDRRVEPPADVVTSAELASMVPAAGTADALSSTWYCAAGSANGTTAAPATSSTSTSTSTSTTTATTGGSAPGTTRPGSAPPLVPIVAEHTVIIANAGARPQRARVTAYPGEGAPVPRDVELPAGSRTEVRLSDLVVSPTAAALVETDGGLVAVDHRLEGPTGRAFAACASSPSPTWFFATGSTLLDSHLVFAVFNPFPQQVVLDFTFQVLEAGERHAVRRPQHLQGFVVPAGRAVSIDVTNEVPDRAQVATRIETRGGVGRVVIDRVQTDEARSRPKQLSVGLGAPSLMPGWVFPDGRRWSGTKTTFVVYNPGTETVQAALAVRVDRSTTDIEPFTVNVLPGEFAELLLDENGLVPTQSAYWAAVRSRSGAPIVVERIVEPAPAEADPQADDPPTGGPGEVTDQVGSPAADAPPSDEVKASPIFQVETAGRSVTLGIPVTAHRWIVAIGGSDQVVAGSVAVTSLADQPVTLTISSLADGQTTVLPAFAAVSLEPGRRTTVALDDALPGDRTRRLLLVEADGPVVVDEVLFAAAPVPSTSQLAAIPVRDTLTGVPSDVISRASSVAPVGDPADTTGTTGTTAEPGTEGPDGSDPGASVPGGGSGGVTTSALPTTTTALPTTTAQTTTTAAVAGPAD